ncbi:MAG TPA: hypothetical protein EYO82_08385 [Gammaproteobacteria bacterium]|nr:hypothetical protein [Gammaproteobacteria bacterium]
MLKLQMPNELGHRLCINKGRDNGAIRRRIFSAAPTRQRPVMGQGTDGAGIAVDWQCALAV